MYGLSGSRLCLRAVAGLVVLAVWAVPTAGQNPKVSPLLERVRTETVKRTPAAKQAGGPLIRSGLARVDAAGKMQVYVCLNNEITAGRIDALHQAGLTVEIWSTQLRIVQGWVAPGAIPNIAALDFVRIVKLPSYGHARQQGSVDTEGNEVLNADQVRAQGSTGQGVKVGVISDGVTNLISAQASGDLPANVTVNLFQGGSGDEGTAMLEIVHDLAPDAELFFSGPMTDLEMVDAIQWLADQGCDVIVDDLWFFLEPYFEDGDVADAAKWAVNTKGRVYCTSAGNGAQEHYQGMYREDPENGMHAFSSRDTRFDVRVAPGSTLLVILQWAEKFGERSSDYSLVLSDGGDNNLATGQDNDPDDPMQILEWLNDTGSMTTVFARVQKESGEDRELELFVLDGNVTDPAGDAKDSIVGQAALEQVISCGAVEWSSPNQIEPFSSQGPATILFPSQQERRVPFCVAPDGVSVTGVGGFPSPFFGTSAAAPHAAGVAALLLSAAPGASSTFIQQVLRDTAADLGLNGFDDVYGYGRLDALAAFEVVRIDAGDDHPDVPPSCTPLEIPDTVPGELETTGDKDVFCLTAQEGATYAIETRLLTLSDSVLELYDTDGKTLLTQNDDADGDSTASRIDFIAPSTGTFFVVVRAFMSSLTGTYELTVMLTAPAPSAVTRASARATPNVGQVPLTVYFSGGANKTDLLLEEWDFGDGMSIVSPAGQHTYVVPGTYTATFTVVDEAGQMASATAIVHAAEPPNDQPSASISTSTASGSVPLTARFTGSGSDPDGTIVSFGWNFGDGATATGQIVEHTFAQVGVFSVVLTVTDNRGATATAVQQIQVGQTGGETITNGGSGGGQDVPSLGPACGGVNGFSLAFTLAGLWGFRLLRRRF